MFFPFWGLTGKHALTKTTGLFKITPSYHFAGFPHGNPLVISVQTDDMSLKHELHLAFKPAFIHQSVQQRATELQNYMNQLAQNIQHTDDNDPDRSGMETLLHICGNMLEYVRNDDLDLNETIIIEIQPTMNITSFLTGSSSIN